MAPKVHTCGQRVIDFFLVSEGLRQAAPAVYTVGDGGFYPRCPARLLLRGRARTIVVRQLKVTLGFEAVPPHGPPVEGEENKTKEKEQLGSDYGGLITEIERELCTIEGREGKEAANKSGRSEGVAYCWKNAMGETIAENSRTTSVSRVWRLSARRLKDIVKDKDKKAAWTAAWTLPFYEHPRPDPVRATQPQLEAMLCFSAWQRSLTRGMLLTPCWA